MLLCLELGSEVSRVRVPSWERVRYLGAAYANRTLPSFTRTHPTYSWAAILHSHIPEPRWKADFRCGLKGAWRTSSLRFEVASVLAHPLGNFGDGTDILPRWEMGRLCFLSGTYSMA